MTESAQDEIIKKASIGDAASLHRKRGDRTKSSSSTGAFSSLNASAHMPEAGVTSETFGSLPTKVSTSAAASKRAPKNKGSLRSRPASAVRDDSPKSPHIVLPSVAGIIDELPASSDAGRFPRALTPRPKKMARPESGKLTKSSSQSNLQGGKGMLQRQYSLVAPEFEPIAEADAPVQAGSLTQPNKPVFQRNLSWASTAAALVEANHESTGPPPSTRSLSRAQSVPFDDSDNPTMPMFSGNGDLNDIARAPVPPRSTIRRVARQRSLEPLAEVNNENSSRSPEPSPEQRVEHAAQPSHLAPVDVLLSWECMRFAQALMDVIFCMGDFDPIRRSRLHYSKNSSTGPEHQPPESLSIAWGQRTEEGGEEIAKWIKDVDLQPWSTCLDQNHLSVVGCMVESAVLNKDETVEPARQNQGDHADRLIAFTVLRGRIRVSLKADGDIDGDSAQQLEMKPTDTLITARPLEVLAIESSIIMWLPRPTALDVAESYRLNDLMPKRPVMEALLDSERPIWQPEDVLALANLLEPMELRPVLIRQGKPCRRLICIGSGHAVVSATLPGDDSRTRQSVPLAMLGPGQTAGLAKATGLKYNEATVELAPDWWTNEVTVFSVPWTTVISECPGAVKALASVYHETMRGRTAMLRHLQRAHARLRSEQDGHELEPEPKKPEMTISQLDTLERRILSLEKRYKNPSPNVQPEDEQNLPKDPSCVTLVHKLEYTTGRSQGTRANGGAVLDVLNQLDPDSMRISKKHSVVPRRGTLRKVHRRRKSSILSGSTGSNAQFDNGIAFDKEFASTLESIQSERRKSSLHVPDGTKSLSTTSMTIGMLLEIDERNSHLLLQ